MRYQPEWIDGRTVGNSRRDAEGRYNAIASYLNGMEHFTALDLGAYSGYFSFRLAEEFGAEVTAVDDALELAQAFEKAREMGIPHRGVVYEVNRRMDPVDLMGLHRFDVVLCLSVLHHVTWWRSMLEILMNKTDILFVETAVAGEDLPGAIAHSPEIQKMVELNGGKKIHETPGFDPRFMRPLYVIDQR